MPATLLIPKPVPSNGIDLALCSRLVQEACRRASASESWAMPCSGGSIVSTALSNLARTCRACREGRGRVASANRRARVRVGKQQGPEGSFGTLSSKRSFLWAELRRHPWTRPLCSSSLLLFCCCLAAASTAVGVGIKSVPNN